MNKDSKPISLSHFKRSFIRKGPRNALGIIITLISICAFYLVSVSEATAADSGSKKLQHDLFSVTFPTENDGWACGRWGTVLHTTDGGKTWSLQQTGTDYTLSSIHFVDAKNGWALGDEGTIRIASAPNICQKWDW